MKIKSKNVVVEKNLIGKSRKKKNQHTEPVAYVYADIETGYTEGNKPFIKHICILNDAGEVILNYYFEDPREITREQIEHILTTLYTNCSVWCDPTEDIPVIKHDARRCGVRFKKSKINLIDIQIIEQHITNKPNRRSSLVKLCNKYNIKPHIKFHDPYSDALACKMIFEQQTKKHKRA